MTSYKVAITGLQAEKFVELIEKEHGPLTVMQQCFDVAECAALASTMAIDVALVIGTTEDLNLSMMQRFHENHVAVVVLTDDAQERERCFQLGTESAAQDVETQQLCELLIRSCEHNDFTTRSGQTMAFDNVTVEKLYPAVREQPVEGDVSASDETSQEQGVIHTFWGPIGSPGKTTLALNAAVELALAGKKTLLVDADTYAASVALMMGLLDESSGLSQLCRLAELGNLNHDTFTTCVETVTVKGADLGVLSGIPESHRWPELRTAALDQVFEMARELYEVVVVDTGSVLEQDEELSFDVAVPQRNAATLNAIAHADKIYAVGSSDVVGVPRLLKSQASLLELKPSHTDVLFVFNKVDQETVGSQPEEQLRYTWQRFGPAAHQDLVFLPFENRLPGRAALAGESLAEFAPQCPLRTKIQELVGVPPTESRTPWWQRKPVLVSDRKSKGRRAKTSRNSMAR